MYKILNERLHKIQVAGSQTLLKNSLTGLEKESLRVNTEGGIAETPHPCAKKPLDYNRLC